MLLKWGSKIVFHAPSTTHVTLTTPPLGVVWRSRNIEG